KAAPVPVITSPEWSGSESGGRRYSPFTINVERKKPWHTLTGRQHFYLDHDWMLEMGEALPVFRPPLDMTALFGESPVGENESGGISVRYLTPHNKWAIHSMYQENFYMMNLSRGLGVLHAQRLGRSGQPQRRAHRPRCGQPPHASGHRFHAPRAGTHRQRAADRAGRQARWYHQLADPDHAQTLASDRWLRTAVLRLQLLRAHGKPA